MFMRMLSPELRSVHTLSAMPKVLHGLLPGGGQAPYGRFWSTFFYENRVLSNAVSFSVDKF